MNFFFKRNPVYLNLKQNLSVESYLSISNFEYRKLITKLRISEYNLLIEKGEKFKYSEGANLIFVVQNV
jgi:hypothetical protein